MPLPARKLMRIIIHPLLGRGKANGVQQFYRALTRRLAGKPRMPFQAFDDLAATCIDRVQARHRLLKDHAHAAASELAHLAFREFQQIAILEDHLATRNLCRRAGQQPHDRQRGHAFPAARFTDKSQRLARHQIETDAVHHPQLMPVRVEPHVEIAQRQNRVSHRQARRITVMRPNVICRHSLLT